MSREEKIQSNIEKLLDDKEIFAYSVICTFELGQSGLIAITVYTKEDLKLLSELLGYESMCDKSGFTWISDTNTVLLEGMALTNLYL